MLITVYPDGADDESGFNSSLTSFSLTQKPLKCPTTADTRRPSSRVDITIFRPSSCRMHHDRSMTEVLEHPCSADSRLSRATNLHIVVQNATEGDNGTFLQDKSRHRIASIDCLQFNCYWIISKIKCHEAADLS